MSLASMLPIAPPGLVRPTANSGSSATNTSGSRRYCSIFRTSASALRQSASRGSARIPPARQLDVLPDTAVVHVLQEEAIVLRLRLCDGVDHVQRRQHAAAVFDRTKGVHAPRQEVGRNPPGVLTEIPIEGARGLP
jgi:hypothetical protein